VIGDLCDGKVGDVIADLAIGQVMRISVLCRAASPSLRNARRDLGVPAGFRQYRLMSLAEFCGRLGGVSPHHLDMGLRRDRCAGPGHRAQVPEVLNVEVGVKVLVITTGSSPGLAKLCGAPGVHDQGSGGAW
jgi:hypothetical protein